MNKKISAPLLLKLIFVIALVALIASACGSSSSSDSADSAGTDTDRTANTAGTAGRDTNGDGNRGTTATPPTFTPPTLPSGIVRVGLTNLSDCNGLLDRFKSEALKIVGPYGLGENRPIAFALAARQESAVAADSALALPSRSTTGADSAPAFSTTNVQVVGVDEPDIVKTDGRRIVGVSRGELWVVDTAISPPRRVSGLMLGERYQSLEIFLYEDKVLATITKHDQGGPFTHIMEIDISSNRPRILNEIAVDGSYVNARLVGSTVNLVVSSRMSNAIGFVFPANEDGEELAEETNRQVILNTELDDWVPAYYEVDEDGERTRRGRVAGCSDVLFPNEFSGLDMLSVITLDMEGAITERDISSVVAEGDTIYSSGENLYVVHRLYNFFPIIARAEEEGGDENDDDDEDDEGEEPREEIWFHKFATTSQTPAQYQASGRVDGSFLNQFSMHETVDEHFWIVTTETPRFDDGREIAAEPESFVTSFRQEGADMVQVGRVGNIGRNERVQSVRFIESRAYVVTFRQIDPFYVVDLASPANPVVRGELKIPGFSSYLHPLGNDRLLGVGREATSEGRVIGAKLSLFDASDPTDPQEVDELFLGSGFTNVEWDHRAVLYWARENRFILPFRSFQDRFYGALAIHVDASEENLREIRRFRHSGSDEDDRCDFGRSEPDSGSSSDSDNGGGTSSSSSLPCPVFQNRETINRALVIGDTLWTVSENYIEARDIADPETEAEQVVRITSRDN